MDQQCEMCGLLFYHLELMHKPLYESMASEREKHDADVARRGVLGRTSRAEMPARVIDEMETYLEERACGNPSAEHRHQRVSPLANTVCRADGLDDSALRLPSGIASMYRFEDCAQRVTSVCELVRREYADELTEGVSGKMGAEECADIVPSCSAKRATKLLGPLYGKVSTPLAVHSIGVRDVWQKMPGIPEYYHNRARHISQVEPPEGWDPDGPREQTLLTPVESDKAKEEL